ncbi:hypothetical protein NUW58_g10642 [Xylaria curta]|uniref:Uncharacterized protein n=1 Tax=Xylaria curta TaxID=42375 RepID=A0ACC1MIR2_9PEZI|nr:hypothetical protein NUW58_g10642 [Xylaria curta]
MGKKDDPLAVVDPRAQVYGVKNLRVVDASAFPLLPPGHPQSTVYALAEKIACDIAGNCGRPPVYPTNPMNSTYPVSREVQEETKLMLCLGFMGDGDHGPRLADDDDLELRVEYLGTYPRWCFIALAVDCALSMVSSPSKAGDASAGQTIPPSPIVATEQKTGSAVRGASLLIILQVASRAITFVANQLLLRFLTASCWASLHSWKSTISPCCSSREKACALLSSGRERARAGRL